MDVVIIFVVALIVGAGAGAAVVFSMRGRQAVVEPGPDPEVVALRALAVEQAAHLAEQSAALGRLADAEAARRVSDGELGTSLRHTQTVIGELRAAEERRREQETQVVDLVKRVDSVFGGARTGRAGESVLQEFFESLPPGMLLTNYRPEANPNDYALWQRIHLIPFELSFVSNPVMKNERKADTSLPEKLKAEASGILAWMVRGCLKYQENGLAVPDKVKAAVDEYRNAEDVIGQFIEDTCIIQETAETQAGKMYAAYCEWCQANGYKPSRANEFVMNMGTRFDSYKKRHRIYVGVALVSE